MKCILITGSIGSGKSLMTDILRNRGYQVYDCDKSVIYIYTKEKQLLEEISKALDCNILDKECNLDKQKLAKIIFSDPNKLELLESLVFPYLIEDIKKWKKRYSKEDLIFIESATALTKGVFNNLIDKVVAIRAELPTRINRVKKRSNLTQEQIIERNLLQKIPIDKVDYWIDNDGTQKELEQKVENLIFLLSL